MSTQTTDLDNELLNTPDAATGEEDAHFEEFARLADARLESEATRATATTEEEPPEEPETPAPAAQQAVEDGSKALPGSDPWANVDDAARKEHEALRLRYEKMEHDALTARAAQSSLQKQLNELAARLERQSKETTAKPSQATGTPQDEAAAPDDGVDLQDFRETYPEIAAAMDALQKRELQRAKQEMLAEMEALRTQVSSLQQPIEYVQQQNVEQQKRRELAELALAHPDYTTIQGDNGFWSWLEGQPQAIQTLANSSRASDNIALLNIYKAMHGSVAAGNDRAANRVTALPRDPATSVALPRKQGAPRMEGVPDDENLAFEYWARQAENGRL